MPDPLSALKPGASIKGTVMARFFSGAIVDISIPNAEGFLHELDSPSRRGPSPVLGLQAGQAVTAWVLDANPTTRRVALTLVDPASLRPRLRLAELTIGASYTGRVVHIDSKESKWAIVDIDAETDGLLHVSEMSYGWVARATDVVHLDQTVRVRVLSIDLSARKFTLTMK